VDEIKHKPVKNKLSGGIMPKTVKARTLFFVLAVTLLPVLAARAQVPYAVPPAPVPSQIAAAKKVFISNAGADGTSYAALKRGGDPQQPYDSLYAAMKSWGRYELVDVPSDADLVFAIRFTAPLTDCGKLTTYSPQLELTILETKSHYLLWTVTEPVEGAVRKATWEKNFGQGMTNLLDDLKKLSGQPIAKVEDPKNAL
jgi:hypothetical protein